MRRYRLDYVAKLTRLLEQSPVRLRLKQLDDIEHLIDQIEPAGSYSGEFLCRQVLEDGCGDLAASKVMPGDMLLRDLAKMAQDLSGAASVPVAACGTCWTCEELAARLRVAPKTIRRWAIYGLAGRKLVYPDGAVRLAFPELSVRRFVSKHTRLVRRAAKFRRVTAAERLQIVQLARDQMNQRKTGLHTVSRAIATRMGRAVETIRYTLRRYDREHPGDTIFKADGPAAVAPEMQALFAAVRAGRDIEEVAADTCHTPASVRAAVNHVRTRQLLARPIQYIYNSEFESPSADEDILGPQTNGRAANSSGRDSGDEPTPYLKELYRYALLSPERERHLFRRYNYLKYRANLLRAQISPPAASEEMLDQIEGLLAEAERSRDEILLANLRLVVSTARQHARDWSAFYELVSDGNLALMHAVERFDYGRGFKFSTYASWAIRNQYSRTRPVEAQQCSRMLTGAEDLLAATPDPDGNGRNDPLGSMRQVLGQAMASLADREREIIVRHYGLEADSQPQTLRQIGRSLGISKERTRQIEHQAIVKLRKLLNAGGGSDAECNLPFVKTVDAPEWSGDTLEAGTRTA